MKMILILLRLMTGALVTQLPKITPLMSKDLTGCPGKEGAMITVEYAPGGSDVIHRHNAHAFVYVLVDSVNASRHQEFAVRRVSFQHSPAIAHSS